ncbi:MAG: hypothetical protein PHG03_05785, partial [Bacilli bacterium]|nr:hypothetical protein [Bacilli bacterium]
MVKFTIILAIKIFLISIGKLFIIHKFFPSKEMLEWVVHDKLANTANIKGALVIRYLEKLGTCSSVSKVSLPKTAKSINEISKRRLPKAVFKTYKGLEKYLLSSFKYREIRGFFNLILLDIYLLFIVTLLSLLLIFSKYLTVIFLNISKINNDKDINKI